MELVLVRHAEVTEESRGRCYGRLDVKLSERGRAQAVELGAILSGDPVAVVASSPRARARDTAQAIADGHGLSVQELAELEELDFGEVEGLTFDEIATTHPELFERWMNSPTSVGFPGGESYGDLHARATAVVSRLRETYTGRVVAVTHAGIVRAVLAEVLGIPGDRIFRVAVDPASITRIEWRDDTPMVRGVNLRLGG